MKFTTLYALSLGPIVLIVIIIAARIFHGAWNEHFAISLLIGLLGITLGWSIALLGTPRSRSEVALFRETSKVLIGLVAGYVGAKVIDPLIRALFEQSQVIKYPIMGVNVLIFLIAFLVSIIGGYTFRNLYPPASP